MVMQIPSLLAKARGGSVSNNFTVGVASLIVRDVMEHRKQAVFINDSDTTIYLAKGDRAVLHAGIRLNPNGGVWILEPDTLGQIWTGPISAISSAGAKNLCFTEDW